jgi:hypothetical protein
MTDDPKDLMLRAVEARDKALTPEQLAYREQVDRRNKAIQAGIKPPASGTFGKPPK